LLSFSIHDQLSPICRRSHPSSIRSSNLPWGLFSRWSLHIKLHSLLSEVFPPYLGNISSTNSKTSGYSFAEPTVTALALRPAFGGTCYSPIYEATPVIVTQYGNASVTATITFSATVTNAQAYALPYEGYAYGVAEVPSITSATTRTTSSIGSETLVVSLSNLK